MDGIGLNSDSMVTRVYFLVGFIWHWTSTILIVMALIGLLLIEIPRLYTRVLEGLAIVLLIASGFMVTAYGLEIWTALLSGNRYERFTFLAARFHGVAAIFYLINVASAFAPQLFWIRRLRR